MNKVRMPSQFMEEARRLLSHMTLEEKASMLSGGDFWHTRAVKRLGLDPVMMTDGPHGLRKQIDEGAGAGFFESHPATCFPTAATSACSFDRSLIREMGAALGEECLAAGVSTLLGPGVNIKRSPLCGRNFEYFSEDPYLSGELASAFIEGVQSRGVGTSVKHYAANNQETRRMTMESVVDERTLHEIYLPAFERAVAKAHPWTVMCSYNLVRADFSEEGVAEYASENKMLIDGVLRERWGFDGMTVSDWGAVNERVRGLEAGLDLEMPGVSRDTTDMVIAAVEEGRLNESSVDRSAARVVAFVLASMANRDPDTRVDLDAHHELAAEIARESIVLLKNDDGILPGNTGQSAAVIGAFARFPRYQGSGSSRVNPTRLDAPYDAFARTGMDLVFEEGYRVDSDEPDGELIQRACDAARGVDIVYVFAGLPDPYETEGVDRTSLSMPPSHIELIERVAEVNPNVVVVLYGGSVIDLSWEDRVRGILLCYLPGQAGARAAVDILLGRENPSGRLAESWPMRLEDNPSYSNFPGDTRTVEYREGIYVGYRYYDTAQMEVRYPFGHGLSYTTFRYGRARVNHDSITAGDRVTVSIDIANTGDCAGAEVVQLYVSNRGRSIFTPEQELKGFERVYLEPGQTRIVNFNLNARAFSYYSTDIHDWCVETGDYVIRIGSASRDIRAAVRIHVDSEDPLHSPLPEAARCYWDLTSGFDPTEEEFHALFEHAAPEDDEDIGGERFSINSTVREMREVWIGRRIYNQILKRAAKESAESGGSAAVDESFIDFLQDAPLRTVLMAGGDTVNRQMLDGVVDMLNGHGVRGFVKVMRGRK